MKKVTVAILLVLIAILALAGCSKEETVKDVYKDRPSIRGVIQDVEEETFLLESRSRVHSGNIIIPKRVKFGEGKIEFEAGDTVIVYYDGEIAEGDPSQINKVLAFEMEEKAEDKVVEDSEVVEDPEGDEDEMGFDDEDYYDMPILSVIKGDKSTELSDGQSAFVHDLMASVEWDKGSKKDFKSDYTIMNDLEVLAAFDSKSHILNDTKNDISVKLYEGLSEALKKALDNEIGGD